MLEFRFQDTSLKGGLKGRSLWQVIRQEEDQRWLCCQVRVHMYSTGVCVCVCVCACACMPPSSDFHKRSRMVSAADLKAQAPERVPSSPACPWGRACWWQSSGTSYNTSHTTWLTWTRRRKGIGSKDGQGVKDWETFTADNKGTNSSPIMT